MVMLGGGNFLKTAEVKQGDMITFKDEGHWQENTKYPYPDGNPRMDFVIKVEVNGEEKSMRLNKTNRDLVMAAYGPDTAKWIGKSAKITKVKAMVAGKMHDMIVLEIPGFDQSHSEEETPF